MKLVRRFSTVAFAALAALLVFAGTALATPPTAESVVGDAASDLQDQLFSMIPVVIVPVVALVAVGWGIRTVIRKLRGTSI